MIPLKTFNMVSQLSHFAWGAWLVLELYVLLGHSFIVGITASCILLAGAKEFIYDMKWETPEDSGGFWGSVEDFSFYCLGIGVAVLTVLVRA